MEDHFRPHFRIPPALSPSFPVSLSLFLLFFSSPFSFFFPVSSEPLLFSHWSVLSFHLYSCYVIAMNTTLSNCQMPETEGSGLLTVEQLTRETDKCLAKLGGSSRSTKERMISMGSGVKVGKGSQES